MIKLQVKTEQRKQILDITDTVQKNLRSAENGMCHVFVAHTTAAITTADLDPGTDLDMLDAFEAIVPDLNYRHPHDPSHVGDHIMASIIGPNVAVPVRDGRLELGSWQRIVLVELDGPRERNVFIHFTK